MKGLIDSWQLRDAAAVCGLTELLAASRQVMSIITLCDISGQRLSILVVRFSSP